MALEIKTSGAIFMFENLVVKKFPNGMTTCEYIPFPETRNTLTLSVIFNDKRVTTILESKVYNRKEDVVRYL
jgi:hypothetical protein